MTHSEILKKLGINSIEYGLVVGNQSIETSGEALTVNSPIDGSKLHQLRMANRSDTEKAISGASQSFLKWRSVPAPIRGEMVRQYGNQLRKHKKILAALVSWEVGKIPTEAEGEVQEMIDICDFAVGLSRQLYGLTIASERPEHRLSEQWHPLGVVGVISAFNFPVAVWCWNAALALVCGNSVIWKPSEKAPLCALACHQLLMEVIKDFSDAPDDLCSVVIGLADAGRAIAESTDIPLVSATGSVQMGKSVASTVGARLGRSLLELGGNNAMILTPSADLDLAIRAIVFSAVGTAGQRCTTLRRLIVHDTIKDETISKLTEIYRTLPIGNPLEDGILVGPLIDADAADAYENALARSAKEGGKIHYSGRMSDYPEGTAYVRPAIVEVDAQTNVVRQETFAPILYVISYQELREAISIQNSVPQGLSSSIFTSDVREAEYFCGPNGSDCGIANVNIGTSGAEIGGAFGGEKETGGGRESGSDSWKNYMRRATNTINYSTELPLAQGIKFDL